MAYQIEIYLPMQWTQVQSLVLKDFTCHGATNPMHLNYWAHALEPVSLKYWAHASQLMKPADSKAPIHNYWAHVLQLLRS